MQAGRPRRQMKVFMNDDRLKKVEELYHAALQRKPSHRSAFLDQACQGDDGLRREVDSLLDLEGKAANFIERPAVEEAAQAMAESRAQSLMGKRLGAYQIVSLVGVGGMGEVYLAQDSRLGRKVALKILPAAVAADQERMGRFVREAKAASALSHPNVAHIYDIGDFEGIHFIAMEYVEGETLAQRIQAGKIPSPGAKAPPSPRERGTGARLVRA